MSDMTPTSLFRPRSRQSRDSPVDRWSSNFMQDESSSAAISVSEQEGPLSQICQNRAFYTVYSSPEEFSTSPANTSRMISTHRRKENCGTTNGSLTIQRLRSKGYPTCITNAGPVSEHGSRDGKIQRNHRSIRKRVFSKVKEGVLLRSVSSTNITMRSNPTTHSTVVPQGLQHAEEHNAAYDSRTTDVGEIRLDSSTNTTHEAGHEPYRLQASIEMQQTITMPYRATIIVYATGPPSIPKASFTHVHLLVKSESGFDVELVDGPVFVQSFQPQDRIVLTVCASIKRNPITPGVFEELYSDIKALLSCSEQTVFTLKVTYHHPQFPQDTSLILRKNCTVTEPVPPHQVIPKSPSSSAVLRVPRDTDSASYHDDTPSVARLSGELRSTRNPGRGSRRPGHGTIVAPKSSGIEQGHTPGHAADAAREVWRHMRLDNRTPSINPDMRAVKQDPPPLRRHDTGVVIAAMKNTALTNKRSIDEETLREWEENLSMTLRTNDMSMRNMADLDMPCGLANVPWL